MSFIVPVYNALRYLPLSIGSVLRAIQYAGAAELIVVDNGSSDGSWDWLKGELDGLAILERHPGRTVGGLRNIGAGRASGELLAFIDSDCVVPEDYVTKAQAALVRTGAAGTGSRYALPPSPHWIEQTWQELHERRTEGTVNYINSGNLVIRAEAFRAIGGFDEHLITGEDAELGQRLARAGVALHEASDVVAVHLGNPKSLGQFFRKQRWHGLGMFGTVDFRTVDRPTALAALQVFGFLLSVWAILGFDGGLPWRVGYFLLGLMGPAILAVGYRMVQGGTVRWPLRAILLYFLYSSARIVAAVDLGRRRLQHR